MKIPRFLQCNAIIVTFAVALLLLLPMMARAGTLCGTVRDAVTTELVPRAGIFLRTPAGVYTGLYGATDTEGFFCVENVPVGIYDVEVRVDNYQVTYLLGVEVTDDTHSVDINLTESQFGFAPPYPNPALRQVVFRVTIGEPAFVRLLIFDIRGRLVRGWSSHMETPGERIVEWNLLDRREQSVPPGIYFAKAEFEDRVQVRSVIVVD